MKKIFYVVIIAALFSACSHSVKTPEVKTPIKLYVFDCGEVNVKDVSLFSPGVNVGKPKKLVATCYLIVHPNGMLMWDTGLPDSLAKKKHGITNGPFHISRKKTLASQLKAIHVDPASVMYLGLSHMHFDHTGNANAFKNATLLMQTEEYDAAFGADPKKYGFEASTYSELKTNKVNKLNGDDDVFGDGSVIILRLPGHTPGHQALYVNLQQTGPVLLTGDLYHFESQRTFRRVPSFNFNKDETLSSMDKFEKFATEHHAQVWIQHDYEQNLKIRHSPEYYE